MGIQANERFKSLRRRITVITPCLNSARYIGEAIESVANSVTRTLNTLWRMAARQTELWKILSRYPHLKILAGPDEGVYSALNRALENRQG